MKPHLHPEPIRTCLAPRRRGGDGSSPAPLPVIDEASGIEEASRRRGNKEAPKLSLMEALIAGVVLFAILLTADLCVRVLLAALTQP